MAKGAEVGASRGAESSEGAVGRAPERAGDCGYCGFPHAEHASTALVAGVDGTPLVRCVVRGTVRYPRAFGVLTRARR